MSNKYKNIAIGVAVAAVALGYLMKSGRDAVSKGAKPEDTLAGKLGLIA